ncbi:hypothetical protein NM208_g16261 [Fusarium decemcellulare]|uniref:Uncharacterized protein n=1 Tax=Fusarium decemcellulare TaxID=57161 RepID=A0ACC1RCJ6_9HYPO|nr:hypothetical protein NM208_g16261 [Fusarium decemcellulare]
MHPSKLIPTQPNKAIFIDSIAILSDPLSSMSSMFSLVSLLTMAYQVRTPLPCVQERLLTLLHTMSPALRTEGQQGAHAYSREEILNSFIHFLSPVLNGMAGMLELLTAVDAFSRPEDFRQFWTLGHSNLIRDFIESGGPLRGMQGYDVPFLETFVKDSSYKIALGKNKGMLLLVPGDAEVGDDVWWDEDEQRLTVTRKGEDDLSNDEPYLEDGSRMARKLCRQQWHPTKNKTFDPADDGTTKMTNPETVIADRNLQIATPVAENVVGHATGGIGDGPGLQTAHGGGHEAEIEIETVTATANTGVDDHEKTEIQGEGDETMMTMETTSGLLSAVL